jgi:hypothetical protein
MKEPQIDNKKIDEFIQKAMNMNKQEKKDLSADEDLSIAIMNLVSLEEHFFFTANKTGKSEYYELLQQMRALRGDLMRKIIKEYEGEVWCISKHLLAASMRIMEYGTKLYSSGKKEEGEEMFRKSYDMYTLFWGLNLNLISAGDVKKINEEALNVHDKLAKSPEKVDPANQKEQRTGFFSKLGDLVKKAVDCCLE